MNGKVCMVTGATKDIGKATALGLAKIGATVVVICHNRARGIATRDDIRIRSGNRSVDLLVADLSSQTSIRQLAQDFRTRYAQLHVLVNSAEVAKENRTITVDGIEATFAINHLAPFLLTNLLLNLLIASAPARIVNVTSMAYRWGKIDFDDIEGQEHYDMGQAYNQSKLANILFTKELARRLKGTRVSVTANCTERGTVAKELANVYGQLKSLKIERSQQSSGCTPAIAAETSLYLASSPDVEGVTGKHFVNRRVVDLSNGITNEGLAKQLWNVSAKFIKWNRLRS